MKRRRRRRTWFRKPSYEGLHGLKAYEEEVVMALIRERGSGNVLTWCEMEPERWNPRYLARVFARLRRRGLTRTAGSGSFWRRTKVQGQSVHVVTHIPR